MRSRGFSPQKIVLIPLRIQVPYISPKELTDLRAAWRFPDACKLIVAMVTSNQQAEIKTLLWAMDILRHAHPNVHLAVLTSNSHHHPSETLAHQFGLTAHTTFVGAPHDLMLWIALADIVWLSGETGCAWFYALSALALGKPVIVPQMPIFQEIIEPGEGAFLTRPQDPVALARCTLACLETCCSASGFANAARQKVAPMVNFDDCLQAYQDFYSRILAERVS
jgi:glycosyltransferase involved in cell wall biosynthesis